MEQSECHPTRVEYQFETLKEEYLPHEGCSARYIPDGSSRHHYLIQPEALDGELEGCFGLIRSCSYCIAALPSSWHSSRHVGELPRSL